MIKNKRGLSEMVGYVILITIGIVMGLLVYQWLKTYVPVEKLECPDGVSMIIDSVTCSSSNTITIKLTNTGLFDIYGINARISNKGDDEIATDSITDGEIVTIELSPGNSIEKIFNVDVLGNGYGYIYLIEVEPVRLQPNSKGVLTYATCGEAKVRQKLTDCVYSVN